MSCTKCRHASAPKPPRIRYTPTFYHQQIFGEPQASQTSPARCTATYHSTVFDQPFRGCQREKNYCQNQKLRQEESKNKLEEHNQLVCSNKEEIKIEEKSCGFSQSKFKKQKDLNPHNHYDTVTFAQQGLSNHTLLWFDPTKQILLKEATDCASINYPQQRKLLQLSSTPFCYPDENQSAVFCREVQEKMPENLQNEVKEVKILEDPVKQVKKEEKKQEKKEEKKEKIEKEVKQEKKANIKERVKTGQKAKGDNRKQPVFKLVKKTR